MTSILRRGLQVLRNEGPAAFAKRVYLKIQNRLLGRPTGPGPVPAPTTEAPGGLTYPAWIEQHEPGPAELERQRQLAAGLPFRPLISVLTPTYNADPHTLRAMLASLQAQTYPFWELCLVDGASTRLEIRSLLAELAGEDERVRVRFLESNLGISGNTNVALEMVKGEFVALLDHDDELAPFALFAVAQKLSEDPTLNLLYSDHDVLSADGQRRSQPLFKPDWSPEILLSANYLTHLTVIRTRLVREVGGFDPEMDGAQDWDLFFKVTERSERIAHLPQVLYHWRDSQGSTAQDIWAKPYAPPAQVRAIGAHLERMGLPQAGAFFDATGYLRVRWDYDRSRKVSIIIPTNGANPLLEGCIASIRGCTEYPNYEIVIANNGPRRPEEFPYYQDLAGDSRIHIVHYEGAFNYSAVNNYGARHAQGDLLLFLNNDTEIFQADWLDELVMWAERPEVGAVGAKLLMPDGKIQHAGVILGLSGFAGHIFAGQPEYQWTLFGLAEWYRPYLALTAACIMLRREVFERVGGFDEEFLLCGNDVELCLRLRAAGLKVIYNPFARLHHLEGATRQGSVPAQDFRTSFRYYRPALASGDPYFNPNLSYWHATPTLARPGETKPLDFVLDYLQHLPN